jgi:hypothetical protein
MGAGIIIMGLAPIGTAPGIITGLAPIWGIIIDAIGPGIAPDSEGIAPGIAPGTANGIGAMLPGIAHDIGTMAPAPGIAHGIEPRAMPAPGIAHGIAAMAPGKGNMALGIPGIACMATSKT